MFGQLQFSVDERNGVVRVTGSGLWSPERAATHFRNLDRALARMRQQRGHAKVLVDLREAAVQMAETASVMNEWTSRIYRETDRVAVICATSLLALQIKRSAKIYTLATFRDPDDASNWLLSGAAPGAARPLQARTGA